MIIVFHFFVRFLYKLCKKRISNDPSWGNITITKKLLNSPLAQRDAENAIRFDPPMYKQRYERAVAVLLHEKWKDQLKKVADVGCGELQFFVFLKHQIQARELVFVDIDELVLRDSLYRVQPLNADYFYKSREQPLTVKVFAGSVSHPDENLLGTDAVVALELIEHLYPDTLEALPYNLFSYVRPKLVVITTPNAEFNVLFENMKKFRHADHKFEWTREQFESWALNLTTRFPQYTVQFDGIGFGLTGSENFGCCSQLAVFIRKDLICDNYAQENVECSCDLTAECENCIPKSSFGICTYNSYTQMRVICDQKAEDEGYKLLIKYEYPCNVDTRTEEEKLLDELKYRIHLFGNSNYKYHNEERQRFEIPLKCLVHRNSEAITSEEVAKSLLFQSNYKIEECPSQESDLLETCVIYEPEMESGASGSDTEGASGYESDRCDAEDGEPSSDWDGKDDRTPPRNQPTKTGVKTQLHLEVGGGRKPQAALYDSGYQRSPSVADESSPSERDVVPIDLQAPTGERPNRLSNILSVFNNFDKINELDARRKERKYFNFGSNLPHNETMRKICQEIARHPIAGPSRDPAKRAAKHPKRAQSSDSDDSVDDVKAIATCILENSLNKIEFEEDEEQRANLIQELAPEENRVEVEVVEVAIQLVENGDLANNNRDVEGNNYPAEGEDGPDAVDNVGHNNVNIDNNNEMADGGVVLAEEEDDPPEEEEEAAVGVLPDGGGGVEVAWSSREALFDVNSQVDLLEEFDVDVGALVPVGLSPELVCGVAPIQQADL